MLQQQSGLSKAQQSMNVTAVMLTTTLRAQYLNSEHFIVLV